MPNVKASRSVSFPLGAHLAKFGGLNGAEANRVLTLFKHLEVQRREVLEPPSVSPKALYFVEQGLLRAVVFTETGRERTLQFAMEGWWLADYRAFFERTPSLWTIEAVEPSMLQRIPVESYEEMFTLEPKLEGYFRRIYQRGYAAAQRRLQLGELQSAEVRYDNFVAKYPAFVQRVPQYMLASLLGVTPEFLSRLRKNRVQRRQS